MKILKTIKKKQNSDEKKILKILMDNHCLTKKELSEKSNISQSRVARLIIDLQKNKLISYEKILGKKRVFQNKQRRKNVVLLVIKNEKVYKKIIDFLTRKNIATLEEIKENLGKARSTTFVHLEKLVGEEIIKKVMIDRKPYYQI